MPDQLSAVPGQRVDTAEGVVPILLGHVLEDVVQPPRILERGPIEFCRVDGSKLGHPSIVTHQDARPPSSLRPGRL